MTDNYRNVNVYRDSQPYSSRKIVIMMRIMLSDIVIGDGVALTLSLTVGVIIDCCSPDVEGGGGGRGGPLIRSTCVNKLTKSVQYSQRDVTFCDSKNQTISPI